MVSSVQFAMCNMKFSCFNSRAFTGAGAVRNVHCSVCRVQCDEEIAFETGWIKLNFMSRNNLLKTNSPSIFYLDGLGLYDLKNLKGET